MAIKVGAVGRIPTCTPAEALAMHPGQEEWYGPVTHPDDEPGSHWYIRPVFLRHKELSSDGEGFEVVHIRWLCFARVTSNTLSMHWRGFSYIPTRRGEEASDKEDEEIIVGDEDMPGKRGIQFPYWYYIPRLADEIEELTQSSLKAVNLTDVILHRMWNIYLKSPEYKWTHLRIRAQSGTVALSAHSGNDDSSVKEIETEGIKELARVLRTSVEMELKETYGFELPDPHWFDDVILATLIKEYGARSYQFSLKQGNQWLFRAHTYFGEQTDIRSIDSLPHMRFTKKNDLAQLYFLLQHIF
jgi:hypothetical protein